MTQHADFPELAEALDIPTTCRVASVSRSTIYKALAGAPGYPLLPSIKLGRRTLVRRESLRNWLAAAERGSIK